MREQPASQPAAGQADRHEAHEPRLHRRDLLAETKDAARRADDQGERAGGIGNQRRRTAEQQGGEGEQRAAPGDGIDRPGSRGRDDESENFETGHEAGHFREFARGRKSTARSPTTKKAK
ncbi:MAG: hypothetical protein WDN28_02975 [Chthoniobacter sp.]